MKYSGILFLIIVFSLTATAQKPKSSTSASKSTTKSKLTSKTTAKNSGDKKPSNTKKASAEKKLGSEKEEFEAAVALTDAAKRIKALRKFIENFPKSEEIVRAQELIV